MTRSNVILAAILIGYSLTGGASADASLETSLPKFIASWSKEEAPRFRSALVDLNNDGANEAIVLMEGRDWCGSGGCTLLVLNRSRGDWKLISKMTITNTPIRVIQRSKNGWSSLGVMVRGGGIMPGYEAVLDFDGKKYPSNPSIVPRSTGKPQDGTVIIP
jgi:hypothetical protein